MTESAVNAYAVKSDNTSATTPTPVAVVSDGTGDRQIVVLGAGDGTTALNDGSNANPLHEVYAAPALSTATWTTGTALNTTLASTSTLGYGTAIVTTAETGTTTTAGALTFEVYDGTNWYAVLGQQLATFTSQSTYTLVNGVNVAWTFDIAGWQGFRVRLSTAITGTGSPQVIVNIQFQATPKKVTHIVGQTTAANLNMTETNAGTYLPIIGIPNINKFAVASNSGNALTVNTVYTPTLTVSGFTANELIVYNIDGAAIIYGTLDNTTPSKTNFAFVLPATPCSEIIPCNATPTVKVISAGTPLFGAVVRGA